MNIQNNNLFRPEDVVSRYTRQNAIDDGVLVDVSETARDAGISFPVAMTRTLWHECVDLTQVAKAVGCDEAGRSWDILWMLRTA